MKNLRLLPTNDRTAYRYCQHLEVSEVGHAIHVENPVQFATIIMEQVLNNN